MAGHLNNLNGLLGGPGGLLLGVLGLTKVVTLIPGVSALAGAVTTWGGLRGPGRGGGALSIATSPAVVAAAVALGFNATLDRLLPFENPRSRSLSGNLDSGLLPGWMDPAKIMGRLTAVLGDEIGGLGRFLSPAGDRPDWLGAGFDHMGRRGRSTSRTPTTIGSMPWLFPQPPMGPYLPFSNPGGGLGGGNRSSGSWGPPDDAAARLAHARAMLKANVSQTMIDIMGGNGEMKDGGGDAGTSGWTTAMDRTQMARDGAEVPGALGNILGQLYAIEDAVNASGGGQSPLTGRVDKLDDQMNAGAPSYLTSRLDTAFGRMNDPQTGLNALSDRIGGRLPQSTWNRWFGGSNSIQITSNRVQGNAIEGTKTKVAAHGFTLYTAGTGAMPRIRELERLAGIGTPRAAISGSGSMVVRLVLDAKETRRLFMRGSASSSLKPVS